MLFFISEIANDLMWKMQLSIVEHWAMKADTYKMQILIFR